MPYFLMSHLKVGPDRHARRGIKIKSLAEYCRSQMGPEEFFRYLKDIMDGKDPGAKEGFGRPVDMNHSLSAAKLLFGYMYGAVPQMIQVEAAMTAELVQGAPAWRELPEDKLRQLRDTVKGLLQPIDVKEE